MDNPIWDHTNACDVLIDTVNSAEALAGSHIGGSTYTFRRPNPRFEDIKHVVDVASNSIEDDGLYQFMDNSNKWDDLPNIAGINNAMGSSHTFTTVNTSGSTNKSIKLDFWIGKRQS